MILDLIFDDKRLSSGVLLLWVVVVVAAFESSMDLSHSEFMSFGPSAHMKFMTVTIDTWDKWYLLAGATFCNSCVAVFMNDSIHPWLQNTIQDHKTKYLPYGKWVCYFISQTWTVYCNARSIFGIALMMSQVDLVLMRMLADLLVNTYTCFKFMKNKSTDRHKYWLWTEDRLREAQNEEVKLVVEEVST